MIDDVIDGLGTTSKSLVSEMGSLKKKRSLTPDSLLKVRSSSISDCSEQHETGSVLSANSTISAIPSSSTPATTSNAAASSEASKIEVSPMGTPQTNKRKSLQGRKLRPKSTTNNNVVSNNEDNVPELPSSSALQHLGKARPRRSKRHAPSRGSVVTPAHLRKDRNEEEDDVAKFYSSASVKTSDTTTTSLTASPMLEQKLSPRTLSFGEQNYRSRHSSKEGLDDNKHIKSSELDKSAGGGGGVGSPSLAGGPRSSTPKTMTGSSGDPDEAKRERRALSPTLQSISDIFGAKKSNVSASDKSPATSKQGISFSSRKTTPAAESIAKGSDSASSTATTTPVPMARRRSFNPGEESNESDNLSPTTADDGKKTPEEVIKRHGVGHGGNLDLMAEIKEKRASMAPSKAAVVDEKEKTTPSAEKNLFGHIKLR